MKMSEEALQLAERRREAKVKDKKERYTHLNVFQRTVRRDKAFLSEQRKEIEERRERETLETYFQKN